MERSEGRRELLFALLALVSVLIGISRLWDPYPAPLWMKVLDGSIALLFLADWASRVARSDRRLRYALTHSYEILTFIPFTLLPAEAAGGDVLRGARFIRLFRFARYGRFAKVGLALARMPRRVRYVQRVVRHAQIVTLLLVGVLIIALGGAALLLVEGRTAGLRGYGPAVWWSLSIFTTTAYAVPTPRTPAGHAVTGVLMVLGVAYVGVFTASLASAILRTPGEDAEEEV